MASRRPRAKSTPPETTTSPTAATPEPQPSELTTRADALTPTRREGLERFEASLGGRDALIDALQLSALDQRQEYFLRMLSDPARSHDSLARIARDAGVPYAEVIQLWRDSTFAKATSIAMAQMSDRLHLVVRDVLDKSVDVVITCPDCMGEPPKPGAEVCMTCSGRGKIFKFADLDRQKMIFESTGLLKRGGGTQISVNQNVGVMQTGSMFSKFVKQSDDAAYAIDADAVHEVKNVKDPA